VTPLEFETSNASRWREFEALLGKTDRDLDPENFLRLYRGCCEHLALAQARGFPAHVIERLAIMTAQGHQIVYRQRDLGLRRVGALLLQRFPAAVRAHRGYVLAAALLILAPALTLYLATRSRPDLILSLVDGATAARFEQMYGPSTAVIGRTRDAGSDWMMFGFYIMNNIGIAFQCYATGILFGVGTVLFLVYNGVFGGAIAGYVTSLGYGATFLSFIATHSAFELTAIVLSGAAGLRLGRALVLPGRMSRLASLQVAGRDTSVIIAGVIAMLVIAAAVEAFWSSAAWVAPRAKYACAIACWSLIGLFFLRRPRAG
jgi:uncharacterized membrane protein SpoIIM required for sporulation